MRRKDIIRRRRSQFRERLFRQAARIEHAQKRLPPDIRPKIPRKVLVHDATPDETLVSLMPSTLSFPSGNAAKTRRMKRG